MSTAGDYRQIRVWEAAETVSKTIDVGSRARSRTERSCSLGLLRVGYDGAAIASPFDAEVKLADDGSVLGPLDVPFLLVAEEPFAVTLTPAVAPPARTTIVLSVVPVTAPSDRLYATRTIAAALNQVIPLPQWVRGVSALANGSFQFRDRAAAPLCVAVTGAHDRPAMAADIIVTAAGTIVLYY